MRPVDYILFFTGDVDVKMNDNEIRDFKYVNKAELQAMFEAEGMCYPCSVVKDEAKVLTLLALPGNLFTPWFKLIARDFLFGWWDELLARKNAEGKVVAQSLADLTQDRVIKMV